MLQAWAHTTRLCTLYAPLSSPHLATIVAGDHNVDRHLALEWQDSLKMDPYRRAQHLTELLAALPRLAGAPRRSSGESGPKCEAKTGSRSEICKPDLVRDTLHDTYVAQDATNRKEEPLQERVRPDRPGRQCCCSCRRRLDRRRNLSIDEKKGAQAARYGAHGVSRPQR